MPEGAFEESEPGSKVSGSFEGSIVEKNGMLYVKVDKINGKSTAIPKEGEEEEKDEMDMNASEILDQFMANQSEAQTQ